MGAMLERMIMEMDAQVALQSASIVNLQGVYNVRVTTMQLDMIATALLCNTITALIV